MIKKFLPSNSFETLFISLYQIKENTTVYKKIIYSHF